MSDDAVCWKCGESIEGLPLPLARLAACTGCGADLHNCKMCRFYDTQVSNQCLEPIAEMVTRKEVANFCGYFQLSANAYQPRNPQALATTNAKLNDLFGGDLNHEQSPSDAGSAQAELNRLFGIDDKNKM